MKQMSTPETPVVFHPFGNIGISISEKVKHLFETKLYAGLLAYLGLRCLEYNQDLFILLVPEEDTLHVGILNASYEDLEQLDVKRIATIKEDLNLFYSNQKIMFVNEIPL